jgi:tetratricopeptide (TPR) repeat protein
MEIRRRLARSKPQVYLPDVARTLHNLGNVLSNLRDLDAARAAYDEALRIFRRLAQDRPQAYLHYVATTLNNLGKVLSDLCDPDAARAAFEEAWGLYDSLGDHLDAAAVLTNWGLAEESVDPVAALDRFRSAVAACEQGLGQLAESAHRDVFKSKVEPAYGALIDHHARQAEGDGQGPPRDLIGFLESQRQVETLSGLESAEPGVEQPGSWRVAFEGVLAGTSALASRLRQRGAALVWTHVTRSGMVFVSLRPGACQVEVVTPELREALLGLMMKIEEVQAKFQRFAHEQVLLHVPGSRQLPGLTEIEAWFLEQAQGAPSISRPFDPEALRRELEARLHQLAAPLGPMGEAAFSLLPAAMRQLLLDPDARTLFLAPCARTMNLPFELLRPPGERFLGLRLLMPRVHGLAELERVLERRPPATGAPAALVVGDTAHQGAVR